jgi:hypothetical protein
MPTKFSSGRTPRVWEFIRTHRRWYEVRQMCRVLEVTHSGYYAWLKGPQSRWANRECAASEADPRVVQCESWNLWIAQSLPGLA